VGESEQAFRCGRVGLLGWTNVGKSTLMNRLVGTKISAVADVAQTTRHRILGALHLPGRAQIVFVDTPGLHRPRHRMNRAMVETARDTPAGVDLALLMVDASKGIGPGDREAAKMLRDAGTPTLLVLNKSDRIRPKSRLLPMIAAAVGDLGFDDVIPVSARTGDGCEHLVDVVVDRLPKGPPDYDDDFLTDQTQRSLAAEWIREKLLALTRQELPHATAVVVESWKERDDGLVEIHATILVERDSQKRIVIGRQGSLLKEVGTLARVELEAFLERRIHLALWVRVRKDWRDDDRILQSLDLV